MNRQIFLSYRWDEKEFVRAFYQELRRYNFKVWIDVEELNLGDKLSTSIGNAIIHTDCFAVFLSLSGFEALKDEKGGFNVEIGKIIGIREARQNEGKHTQVVLVDLAGFSSAQIADIPALIGLADDWRLAANVAYKKFKRRHNRVFVRQIVREFIAKALRNELRLFPRPEKVEGKAYLLSWVGCGKSDSIDAVQVKLSEDRAIKPFIPIAGEKDDPCLKVTFSGQVPAHA